MNFVEDTVKGNSFKVHLGENKKSFYPGKG